MNGEKRYFEGWEGADIDELADAIAEYLQNPITIEDADHKLLAYSSHGETTDPARWSTIMGRRVPENVLTRLWKDGVFHQLMTQDDPVHIPPKDEVGLGKRVAIAIRKGDEVLGYIWAQEVNRTFTPEDDEILRQASKAAVSKLMQRQGKRKQLEQRRKEFFWELLLGNHKSEAAIRQKAAALQMDLPSPYLICIFESSSPQLEQLIYPLTVRDRLLWVKDGEQCIVLLGPSPVKTKEGDNLCHYAEQFVRECLSRVAAESRPPLVGYGRPQKDWMAMERSYQDAIQVLQVKRLYPRETETILGYHDLGMYRFLPCLKAWADEEGYVNERLEWLQQYDRENQTNLTETLEVFLDAAGKANVTAQRLHIHINTLGYRLKRIEEIMNVDLDDPNQRTCLYLDLKLRKLSS